MARVGRQHQPEFFELLVPVRDRLACISRLHFEVFIDPGASAPTLRKLSGNPLLVEDRALAPNEAVPLPDGSNIGFSGVSDADPSFLVLNVKLRTGLQVREGSYTTSSAMQPCQSTQSSQQPWQPSRSSGSGVSAVLECVKAVGTDVQTLSAEARAIALPLDRPVEVGRQHQLGFFDRLLQADAYWLTFISRTHCRVVLAPGAPSTIGSGVPPSSSGSQHSLKVEHLSTNPIFLNGRPLMKGQQGVLVEGGTLTFIAKGRDDKETTFLEFVLRRARCT